MPIPFLVGTTEMYKVVIVFEIPDTNKSEGTKLIPLFIENNFLVKQVMFYYLLTLYRMSNILEHVHLCRRPMSQHMVLSNKKTCTYTETT